MGITKSSSDKIVNKRVLSGVQPSGGLHLGNYFGAIKQHIELQSNNQCFYFIANYHAMTTIQDAKLMRELSVEVAAAYLALGLDPKRVVFYLQSDVPEVCELAWILGTVTGMGLFERAHSYKDKTAKGIKPSVGLFTYPALMAADILIVHGECVPVGEDQVQHIEMTQDMAEYFNRTYKTDILRRPEYRLSHAPKILGLDGQKMSKSYGNSLEIFAPPSVTHKKIMSIKTDSTPVEQPKNPDSCLVLYFLKLLASDPEIKQWEERYRKGPMGYGEVKGRLLELFEATFSPARKRRERLLKDTDTIDGILADGALRARSVASPLMDEVRHLCGISKKKLLT